MTHGDPIVPRQLLHDLPYTLGAWTGEEQPLQERVVQAVGVSDYTRHLHSPKNCLPGAGWDPIYSGYATVSVPSGRKIVGSQPAPKNTAEHH